MVSDYSDERSEAIGLLGNRVGESRQGHEQKQNVDVALPSCVSLHLPKR